MRSAPAVLMHLEGPRPLLLPQLKARRRCCAGALIRGGAFVVGSLRRVARAGSRRGKRASAPSREAQRRGRAAPAQFRAPAAGIARSPVAGGIFSLAPRPRPRPRRSFGKNARGDRFTLNWHTDLVHLPWRGCWDRKRAAR